MRSLTVVCLLLCTGCFPISAPFHIYPVNQAPGAFPISCRFKLHFGWQSATVTVTMPNGDIYSGSLNSSSPRPDNAMAASWDQVFGNGYFTAKVLGSQRHMRFLLHNLQGDELRMELHTIPGDNQGGMEGVALDHNNHLYKAGY